MAKHDWGLALEAGMSWMDSELAKMVNIAAIVVGVVLSWLVGPLRSVGSVILLLSLVALVPTSLILLRRGQFGLRPAPIGRTRTVLGSLAILVMTAGMAAILMALSGLTIRNLDEANYAKRYGTTAEVKLPEKCFYGQTSAGKLSHNVTCDGATWKTPQDGAHTGTLKLAWRDSGETDGSVRAYTIGATAYSKQMADFGAEFVFMGRFPLWLLALGLPLVLLGYAGLVFTDWGERPKREAVAESDTDPTDTD